MSGLSTNRGGSGGFPKAQTGGTLADGTHVADVFDEIREKLTEAGYHQKWVDGWKRESDGAVVTHGYTYRQVRVSRFEVHNGPEKAVLEILKAEHLDALPEFLGDNPLEAQVEAELADFDKEWGK